MKVGRGILTLAGWAVAMALAGDPAGAWTLSVCRPPDAAPYRQPDGRGIDDRVAAILAGQMGARLETVALPDGRMRTLRRVMHAGGCDIAFGITDKQKGFQTSQVYYTTGFVFVARDGAAPVPASLDDPALRRMRIGVAGDARHPIPPVIALARRGMTEQLHYFPGARLDDAGTARMLSALEAGEIDTAVMWGPVVAVLERRDPSLRHAMVVPEIDLPVLPMIAMFTIGTRPGDMALRDDINRALFARWDEIQTVLAEAGLPLRPAQRPRAADGGRE